jgi:hypothetical protein
VWQAASGSSRVVAVLEPQRYEIVIDSQPPNAQIWLDGVFLGSAPVTVRDLPVGRQLDLKASLRGREEATRSMVIEPDPEPRVVLRLPRRRR